MMAGSRETRCISVAFDFLKAADFCHECIPIDSTREEDSFDIFSSSPEARCEIRKSESDSALLECQEENLTNMGKMKVCLCENDVGATDLQAGSCSSRDSDFLQGYINRYTCAKGEKEQTDTKCSTEAGCEKNKTVSHIDASHRTLDEKNGMVKERQFVSSEKESCETSGIKDISSVIVDDTDGKVSTAGSCSRNRSEDDVRNSDSSCAPTDEAPNTQSVSSMVSLDASNREEQCKGEEIDDNEEEVVMRLNRKSLNRRSTDTALVSSVFNFLPQTDSVFLPTGYRDSHSSEPTSTATTNGNHVLSSVAENDLQIEKNDLRAADEQAAVFSSSTLSESRNGEENSCVNDDEETVQNCCHSSEADQGSKSEEDDINLVKLRRSRLTKQESMAEEEGGSGDSSDEDAGVYSESFRRSNWIRVDDDGKLELAFPAVDASRLSSASKSSTASRSSALSSDVTDGPRTPSPRVTTDEPLVFPEKCPSPRLYVSHKRSDSTSTTLSEKEFKKEYVSRRKCLIQRQNSSKEYHRYSAKVYDGEKSVVMEKYPEESDYGLHILDSQPAYITRVDPGSAAERAGVEEGQILVSVNGTNVLSSTHDDIVALIICCASAVRMDVATSDFQPSRDLQASIIEGFMQKLGSTTTMIMRRRWKKRYFVLRQDSCLYYYKQKDDSDPLGAIPLAGYTFSRHLDSGRDYCFKAEKYGARTYYFMTESRDEMTEWVGMLSEAAARSKKRKDSFVSVSSHNVGLPALEVRRPECSGYLHKVGNRHKTWHRRYCILKDACLYYYKNVNSLSALGVAHLHGYKVDPSISVGKRHAFGLVPPVDTLRTFQFSAENETDRTRWVDAMIRSIQRWVQIDNDC